MSKFIKLIEESYKDQLSINQKLSKLEFVGEIIFDFTTYDSELDSLFAEEMIEVIESLIDRTTFEYIKDTEKYIRYITMCNMPFLVDKLEWGGSIRGAWLDNDKRYFCGAIIIEEGELTHFLTDLIKWVNN